MAKRELLIGTQLGESAPGRRMPKMRIVAETACAASLIDNLAVHLTFKAREQPPSPGDRDDRYVMGRAILTIAQLRKEVPVIGFVPTTRARPLGVTGRIHAWAAV